jgi:hypothetical protein
MSAALFDRAAGGRHGALWAGTAPAQHVHARSRDGRARAGRRPLGTQRKLIRELAEQADVVVTMGCGEEWPTSPASATSTGTSKTPPDDHLTRYAPPARTSPAACSNSSVTSTKRHRATSGDRRQRSNVPSRCSRAAASRRGCRIKPSEKTRSTPAEVHLRAAVHACARRTRWPLFGTHPYKRSSGLARGFPDSHRRIRDRRPRSRSSRRAGVHLNDNQAVVLDDIEEHGQREYRLLHCHGGPGVLTRAAWLMSGARR